MTDGLLTTSDAAKRLGVSVRTVRRWVRNRRIPSLRCGQRIIRLRWRDVVEALRQDLPSRPGEGTS